MNQKILRNLAMVSISLLLSSSGARAQPGLSEITPGPSGVTASGSDGNAPANVVDHNLGTRWSAFGDGQWIQLDLGSTRTVALVKIAVYRGSTRSARFDIQVSNGGGLWSTVFAGQSGGNTTALETYDFADVTARFVRVLGHGTNLNLWNSLTEVEVWAAGGG